MISKLNIFGYVEFAVPMGHPCGLGKDCLKRLYRIRRGKGKEWNLEENQHRRNGQGRRSTHTHKLIRSNKKNIEEPGLSTVFDLRSWNSVT